MFRRRGAIALAALVALLIAGALAPGSAWAHAQLEKTSPQRDDTVKTEPKLVTFTFGEAVSGTAGAVRVFNTAGVRVDDGNARHPGSDAKVFGVALKPGLPKGTYTATYRIVSADSHIVTGGFSFSIGARSNTSGATVGQLLAGQSTGAVTSDAFIAVRAVQYLAIATGAGGMAFLLLVWLPALAGLAGAGAGAGTGEAAGREGGEAPLGDGPGIAGASDAVLRRMRRLLRGAALAGVVTAVLALGLEGAEAAGVSLAHAYTGTIIGDVLGQRFGVAWLAAGVIWLVALVAAPRVLRSAGPVPARRLALLALALAALVALPAIAGHSSAEHPVWLLLPANIVHVSAMTVWLGGLVALVFAAPAGTRALEGADRTRLLAGVLSRFSPIALTCVIVLVTTGTIQALVEIDAFAELTNTAYGRAVLIKIGLILILIALGAHNRQRTVPRIKALAVAGETPGNAGVMLRNALRAEVGVIAVVLLVSGALSGYPPAKTVYNGPISITTAIGSQQLQFTLDPARVGSNVLHIYLLNPKTGAPFNGTKQLTMTASLPAKGIGPIDLAPQVAGPGHYVINQATFGAPGSWTIDVADRVSAFDQFEKKITVRIR